MVRPNKQRLTAIIRVEYDAEVFDGDPEDAFEFAQLEKATHEGALEIAMENQLGEVYKVDVVIAPALT